MKDLEALVKNKFKGIKNTKAVMPDYNKPAAPYGENQCGKLIKMVPYDFTNEIKIIWNLPYFGN